MKTAPVRSLIIAVLVGSMVIASASAQNLTPAEAKSIAQDGYIFGLPLVYIGMQSDVQTNTAAPRPGQAPFNQFDHHREFPDAKNNKIVGMNVDTLYSLANLDLSAEPIVLVVPPIEGKRWWLMQILDAWNDVPGAPSSRTHDGKGGAFALVGPDFDGTLPADVEVIRLDTNLCLIGGRTYTAGPSDYSAVHAIQNKYQLIPLSKWKGRGTKYTPPASAPVKPGVDSRTPVPAQVFKMSADQFFGRLCELLTSNPARAADAPITARLARIGVKPGAKFSVKSLDADTREAIDEGIADAQKQIRAGEAQMGAMINGWQIARDLGRYGTKYLYRASWTYFAVGGNLVEDAIYPLTLTDSQGNKLDAANKYVLRFAKGQTPPVDAFWSLTLYDTGSYLVPNSINRYALGDRSGVKPGADGSMTIYLQNESPGAEKEANWLPTPKDGGFKLALRLYVPRQQVTDGTWTPPAVEKGQ